MTSREFCYWLQGYFEIHIDSDGLNAVQTEVLKKHLSLVFTNEIDPSYSDSENLNKIHNHWTGKNPPGGLIARC